MGLAENYLEPLKDAGVDTVVLGCTHYPLLTGVIQLVMGDDVTLVSSAEETAKMVYRTLSERDLLAEPVNSVNSGEPGADRDGRDVLRSFESTGDPQRFANLATRFLGPSVAGVAQIPDMMT